VGQQKVFVEAEETLEMLKGLKINAKQIERVCHHYGDLIEQQDAEMINSQVFREYEGTQGNQLHYAMIDGAMYLTKEEQWKEAKLGRIFNTNENVNVSKNRSIISNSTYVSHLGGIKDFFPKLEYHLDGLKSVVIIADGAKWIWNWADDFYPEATQILDFYHAKEHLCEFAVNYFKESTPRSEWIDEQCRTMLEEDTQKVIGALKDLPMSPTKKLEQQKKKLINYYQKNRKRMRYSAYIKKGLLIGSGAIESAHRNVLQQRMKLSGQHWTKKGFQQISNLRVVYKSNNSSRIRQLVKNAA
jgi:hypothetical protein